MWGISEKFTLKSWILFELFKKLFDWEYKFWKLFFLNWNKLLKPKNWLFELILLSSLSLTFFNCSLLIILFILLFTLLLEWLLFFSSGIIILVGIKVGGLIKGKILLLKVKICFSLILPSNWTLLNSLLLSKGGISWIGVVLLITKGFLIAFLWLS